MINCPKIGKVVKIHDCVLTDCNYEKGHLICTGKSYVHCSFCEAIQPSLKEQMHGAEKDPVQVLPFDHHDCILCDHVIVQQVLGNKCKMSGALCCYMRSCPEEDRKKREAVKEARENPCTENGCTDTENCDEICQHSRIYSPVQMQQAIAQATAAENKRVLKEIVGFMTACNWYNWCTSYMKIECKGKCDFYEPPYSYKLLKFIDSLRAQPEPKEREPE